MAPIGLTLALSYDANLPLAPIAGGLARRGE